MWFLRSLCGCLVILYGVGGVEAVAGRDFMEELCSSCDVCCWGRKVV